MQAMLMQMLSFDRLMGPALVRLVYYFGAVVIVVVTGFTVVMALMAVFAGNFGQGAMQLIASPAVGVVVFIYWRFLCELFMLAFLAYERMGEIRDRLPDYSQF